MAKRSPQAAPSERLLKHLRNLEIPSVAAYQEWCEENEFGVGLNKPNRMFARERRFRLAERRNQQRETRIHTQIRDQKMMLALARQSEVSLQESHGHLRDFKRLAYQVRQQSSYYSPRNLVSTIEHLTRVRSRLIDPSSNRVSLVPGGITLAESLVLLVETHDRWRRPIDQWKPRTKNARRQFRSLVRHLLDEYDEVPQMMDQAWAIGIDRSGCLDDDGVLFRRWWVDLGAGFNLRRLHGLPIDVTKRMAHHFMRSPDDLTIRQAFRWAQVRSLGGDDRLARSIVGTRLGNQFQNEDFWITVIRWLIDHPELDHVQHGPVADFLHNRKFVPDRILVEQRVGVNHNVAEEPARDDTPSAPEPNLTMKGRTAQSLLRAVDLWHRSLSRDHRIHAGQWQSIGLPEFSLAEGNEESTNFRIWTIRELLTGRGLSNEGSKMKHCVASYIQRCKQGISSIWTLELESYNGLEKCVTLEVDPKSRTIVQARGKRNRMMSQQERKVVQRWCSQARLQIARYA